MSKRITQFTISFAFAFFLSQLVIAACVLVADASLRYHRSEKLLQVLEAEFSIDRKGTVMGYILSTGTHPASENRPPHISAYDTLGVP